MSNRFLKLSISDTDSKGEIQSCEIRIPISVINQAKANLGLDVITKSLSEININLTKIVKINDIEKIKKRIVTIVINQENNDISEFNIERKYSIQELLNTVENSKLNYLTKNILEMNNELNEISKNKIDLIL